MRANPGRKVSNSDVAVPISAYPILIDFIEANRRERGVSAYSFGHAGDGNIHVLYVYAGEQESAAAWAMNTAVVYKAIELGGTATGEHGIGLGKTQFMQSEHGQALQLMRVVKTALDPNWILNPGKIFVD